MTIMWYLYAIADADEAHAIGAPKGIDDSPVKTLVAGDLAAVAGEVDAAGFRAARRQADLSEDGWLARAVRAHDRVIWRAFNRATVLPYRFGALFATQDVLTGWLRTQRRRLRDALGLVHDAAEWDIQVQTPSDVDGLEVPDLPSGTAWIMSRQQSSLVHRAVHAELVTLAVRAHDGFYLVRRDNEGALARKVSELVERFPGTQIKMTGPQPAYHFVATGRNLA